MAAQKPAQKTAANQRNSPLLRLPAELRNQVYHYALGGRKFEVYRTACKQIRVFQENLPAFALLLVCSQIYAETRLLPYSLNAFEVERIYGMKSLQSCLSLTQCSAIETLIVSRFSILHPRNNKTFLPHLTGFKGLKELILACWDLVEKRLKPHSQAHLTEFWALLQEQIPGIRVTIRGIKTMTLEEFLTMPK
jgi:hypothetical protein